MEKLLEIELILSEMTFNLGYEMTKDTESIIGKYEERFLRRLGEIAILLHLARSPEGSHAYEMRQKASEILFEKRNIGKQFLQKHLNLLILLQKISKQSNLNPDKYSQFKEEFLENIEECPIFKYNLRIQKMLSENYIFTKEDSEYIDDLIGVINEAIKEMKDTSVIWSNVSGVYPAIDSLEKNGLIELSRKDLEGDRLKKIYVITELGRESLSRVLVSLMDISSFILDSEVKPVFHKTEGILSPRLDPFRKIFLKISNDLSPDFKKKVYSSRELHHNRPFVHMMMEQGMANPRLNILVNHPEMLEEHLDNVETLEEKNMLKTFIRNRLIERRKKIDKLLEKL